MNLAPLDSSESVDRLLGAVAEQVALHGERYELVVIGGSALLALGLVSRVTRDVDLVGVLAGGAIVSADPLPEPLRIACDQVARDYSLPAGWLNAGPTSLLDLGLPDGFMERLHRRDFGPGLSALFASRVDQIHFKLYALADQGPGKHEDDLRALDPSREELRAAAIWSQTHDPSDGYREVLNVALAHLGVDDEPAGT